MTQIGLNYLQLLETKRANLANEQQKRNELAESSRHNVITEGETNRTNLANEAIKQGNLDELIRSNQERERETRRSNLAKEAETYRSNRAKEFENNRSNVAREWETHRSNLRNEEIKKNTLFNEMVGVSGVDPRYQRQLKSNTLRTMLDPHMTAIAWGQGVMGLVDGLKGSVSLAFKR